MRREGAEQSRSLRDLLRGRRRSRQRRADQYAGAGADANREAGALARLPIPMESDLNRGGDGPTKPNGRTASNRRHRRRALSPCVEAIRRGRRGRRGVLRDSARLVPFLPRPVGLRQDHHAAADRRVRAARPRRGRHRRPADGRHSRLSPAGQHGVPALCAVRPHDRRRECRLWPEAAPAPARPRRDRATVGRRPGAGEAARHGAPADLGAVGRPAAAGRARPRAHQSPDGAAARRAAGSSCRTCSARSASPSSW